MLACLNRAQVVASRAQPDPGTCPSAAAGDATHPLQPASLPAAWQRRCLGSRQGRRGGRTAAPPSPTPAAPSRAPQQRRARSRAACPRSADTRRSTSPHSSERLPPEPADTPAAPQHGVSALVSVCSSSALRNNGSKTCGAGCSPGWNSALPSSASRRRRLVLLACCSGIAVGESLWQARSNRQPPTLSGAAGIQASVLYTTAWRALLGGQQMKCGRE